MDEITRLLGSIGSTIPITALLWSSKKNLLLSDLARDPYGEWEAGIKDPSGMWVSGDKEGTAHLSTLGASTLAANAAGTIANAVAGRKSTTAGNVFNAAGDIAGFIPGPYGALVSGALKTIGGGINALFGSYVDEAFVRETNQNIASTLGQSFSANNSADFMRNALNRKQIGSVSTSLVGVGPKARRVAADLNRGVELANKTSVTNLSLSGNQVNRTLAMESLEKLSAFGGPLGAALANRFALGGVSQLFGGNFSNGLKYIDAGLTHEENPYNGVLLGVDSLGTPNLVEEGERIFDDYVFSKRLIVPKKLKGIYKEGGDLKRGEERLSYDLKVLNKFSGLSYADAAEKAEKLSGAKERPNDPIAKRGLLALLAVLAESQEKERYEEALRNMLKLIENMSPEEYSQMQEEMALLEYMAEQQAAAELQAVQQLAMQELQMAQMSPEELQAYLLQMMQKLMQEEGMALQLPLMSPEEIEALQRAQQGIAAYGGRLFATGGPFEEGEDGSSSPFEAFLKNLNIDDLRIYFNLPPKKQQRIYKQFASQYLKDKNNTGENRDDLDKLFSEFATNKLNEITQENNRNNWLKGKVAAEDFKDVDENTLKAFAKTHDIKGDDKEAIIKNIVDSKLTREDFNKKYSTLSAIATPAELDKDAASGEYIWPKPSTQQGYDWGADEYIGGKFGVKGSTKGHYKPGEFPETIGGQKYESLDKYELSDPYLRATWDLMQDAKKLYENPDGNYTNSPLTLYNNKLSKEYTWNSKGVGKTPYELMIPEDLRESFNGLQNYNDFVEWIKDNRDTLRKYGNRRFDGIWGERHYVPSSEDGLPTVYYYKDGDTIVPVEFNPDANSTSYHTVGDPKDMELLNHRAMWQLLEPSPQGNLILSPTTDILDKGINTQTGAVGAVGAGGTPFPKPNNVTPLFGLGLGLAGAGVSLNDALNPDYSDFDAAANYAKGMGRFMPISFIPAGERFEYTPMDIDYINSVSRNANNAGLSYLRNAANGNIGAGMAGYLGLMLNYLKGVGENYVKVDELNSKNKYLATAGNLERSKFNSLGHLDAAKANQDAYLKSTSGAGDLLAKLAIGKQSVRDAAYKRFGDNLSASLSMANTYLTNRDNNRLLGWYMQNGQADDLNDIQKSNYVKNRNNNLYWWQRRG